MRHIERSKSGLFLMELLINLLLFCILCGCGLMFFIKSNNMTRNTTDLHQAVRITSSIASIYEVSDGKLDTIQDIYTQGTRLENILILYFDENYAPCNKTEASYEVRVQKLPADTNTLEKVQITFYDEGDMPFYTIDACHFSPSTLESAKEVR